MRGRRGRGGAAALCAVLASVPAVAADPAPPAVPVVERARFLMGTRLTIEARGEGAEAAVEAAYAEVARLEQVLSNWRADSEVSRLNAIAAERPFACSPDLFAAVTTALAWAERTGGTFDPTVEPLVRRLGLRGDEGRLPGAVPEPAADPGPAPIGWRLVEVDATDRSVRFLARGAGLDFGGIGKGIGLDAAAGVLKRAGVGAARLDFGGQALVYGRGPDDGGWRLGLADPRERDLVVGSHVLRRGSMACSGNSERAGRGGTVPHLLDPARGGPAAFDGSVTVIAADATSADALSKALFVMGPERGLAYAAEHDLDVVYLRRERDGSLLRLGRGGFAAPPEDSTAGPRGPAPSGPRPSEQEPSACPRRPS